MSSIIDPTTPFYSIENTEGGLDIFGFQEEENRLQGTEFDDNIFGGSLNDKLFGLDGDDLISGFEGDDVISGGSGNDTLIGGAGADAFDLFAEDFLPDDLSEDGTTDVVADDGSRELDLIADFNPEEDKIRLNNVSSDSLVEYDPHTGILSVDGNEVAQLPAGLEIDAHNFEFRLCGTDEDDSLEGGENSDVLISGIGQDTLVGNGGEDTFLFEISETLISDDIDTIEDFKVGEDKIRFEGISSEAKVEYDSESGILSIDGDDIAQLEPGLDISDDDYEFL